MCGRFTNEMTWAELDALYSIYNSSLPPSHMPPRYNIARTQSVYFAHTDKAGALQVYYDPVATLADIEPAPPLQVGDLRFHSKELTRTTYDHIHELRAERTASYGQAERPRNHCRDCGRPREAFRGRGSYRPPDRIRAVPLRATLSSFSLSDIVTP